MAFTGFVIDRVCDSGAIWVKYVHEGRDIYREPMAKMLRNYFSPEYEKDLVTGDIEKGFAPETAFAKLRFSKAFDYELGRA